MKNKIALVTMLGLFLNSLVSHAQIPTDTTPIYRINTGTGNEVIYDGKTFTTDNYFSSQTYGNSQLFSQLPEPFSTDRYAWGSEEMEYSFPVENGDYVVVLYFAENYFGTSRNASSNGTGDRVFDISIEGIKVLDDFDIFAKVGGMTPTTETFVTTTNDGILNVYFSSRAEDGGSDLPKICAFEILKVNDSPSDTTQPTISNFISTGGTETSVSFSWSSSDNVGVTSQFISYNGTNQNLSSTATTTTISGLTADTQYTFTLNVADAGNNLASSSLTVTTLADGTPPSVGNSPWALTGNNVHYDSGNVGIGTGTPDEKLAVNGNIHAKEVRVDLQGWPDYVFANGYNLPTLEEVQQHIDEKGHLPNIPSANEIEANGLQLGEMNKLLLEKIEELTLYVIELKNEVSNLKNK